MNEHFNDCDCEQLREVLSLFIDNELDEDVAHSFASTCRLMSRLR